MASLPDLLRWTPMHREIVDAWHHAAEDAADDATTGGEAMARAELAALLLKVVRLAPAPCGMPPSSVRSSSSTGSSGACAGCCARARTAGTARDRSADRAGRDAIADARRHVVPGTLKRSSSRSNTSSPSALIHRRARFLLSLVVAPRTSYRRTHAPHQDLALDSSCCRRSKPMPSVQRNREG
jgi:hypothetical protein